MANERVHMNTQGGSRLRQATAVKGKTQIGSRPTVSEVASRISYRVVTDVFQAGIGVVEVTALHRHFTYRPVVQAGILRRYSTDCVPTVLRAAV